MERIASTILMIRPVHFYLNEETAKNNYFQNVNDSISHELSQNKALEEFDNMVDKLRSHGIEVIVIEDTIEPSTPDSIFPNNWVSFHRDGSVGIYPMFAPNRRKERRKEIFDMLKETYHKNLTEIVDFTTFEEENKFLEGTGSLVIDRYSLTAYAALSGRTHPDLVDKFCARFGYEAVKFVAYQSIGTKRLPIYHTNVMMCIGDSFAVICLDSIDDQQERKNVVQHLTNTGKEIISISEQQTHQFAGNMLQLANENGERFIVMSSAAFHSLNEDQLSSLEKYGKCIHSDLTTIETLGGGSARCMIAEIFLSDEIAVDS
jgi:hypothetical protein